MGFLSTITEKRSASDSVSSDNHWLVRWFGGGGRSDAGVYVGEHTALNTLSVVACVMILADIYASLPLAVFRRMEPRGRERARTHSLYRVLHDEPNPRMTSFTYRHLQMTHMATWGNHYSQIQYGRSGDVIALWPFHPSEVEPYVGDDGAIRYRVSNASGTRVLSSDEILHLRGLSIDGIKGLSPLSMMRNAIGVAVAAESYAARFYANDARPSVLLTHPGPSLSDSARKNILESWSEVYGGHRNAYKTAILEEGMSVETLSIPMQDAQFLETRRFEVQEFARFFRIPPHLLADVERSTSWGTGIEQQNIGFVVYTMRPWFERAEQEFNRSLLHAMDRDRYFTKFVIDGLLRGDASARGQFYNQLWNMGALSPNDIRELEDQNPVPGGDEYYVPLNMTPASMIRDAQAEPTTNERALVPVAAQRDSRTAFEWRVDLSPRAERSATMRRRLAQSHRPMFRDVAHRLIRREAQDIRAAMRRHLQRRSIEDFRTWLWDYYQNTIPATVQDRMYAPVRSLVEAISIEAADEVNSDPLPDEDVDLFVREYVEVMSFRYAGDSRARILARINKVLSEHGERDDLTDDLRDVLEDELEFWEDNRPDETARDETQQGANATAKKLYAFAGIATIRWVTAGDDPCEFCLSLNDRVVGSDDMFIGSGSSIEAGGGIFSTQSNIGHPPLHGGCQCTISPG
jgi:HK97 family phage portal protein